MTKYFYGPQSDLFSFYRMPKLLFQSDHYKKLSTDAKVLYGLLLDRMDLSAKNGWCDEQGRVYIIFTVEEIMEKLNCGNKKASQLLSELEIKAGLIERLRQGLGKPNLIYVLNFIDIGSSTEGHFLKCENDTSGSGKTTPLEVVKGHGINTDNNKTEYSDTDSFFSEGNRYETYHEYFLNSLDVRFLEKDSSVNADDLHAMVDLLVETCCSNRKYIRINREDMPTEIVKSRFMKLNSEHIRYALMTLNNNTSRVKDMKQYMLAVLYNAPITINAYYQNWVNHDMANGLL